MEFIQVTSSGNGNSLQLILFVVVLATAIGFARQIFGKNHRALKRRKITATPIKREDSNSPNNWSLADPRNQLEAIAKADFERQRLLNSSEFRVFRSLEEIVSEIGEGHRVMAQTSVGELLRPKSNSGDWKTRKDAHASINSKRFDFAVVDKNGMLSLAVEYHGEGHHQSKAFMRDAVKREVCRRAGVPFLEVEKGTKPSDLRHSVLSAIRRIPKPAAEPYRSIIPGHTVPTA